MNEVKATNGKGKKAALFAFFLIAAVRALTLFLYLRYKATHISTDDAFVEGAVHVIAPKIEGTIMNVLVRENSRTSCRVTCQFPSSSTAARRPTRRR